MIFSALEPLPEARIARRFNSILGFNFPKIKRTGWNLLIENKKSDSS